MRTGRSTASHTARIARRYPGTAAGPGRQGGAVAQVPRLPFRSWEKSLAQLGPCAHGNAPAGDEPVAARDDFEGLRQTKSLLEASHIGTVKRSQRGDSS